VRKGQKDQNNKSRKCNVIGVASEKQHCAIITTHRCREAKTDHENLGERGEIVENAGRIDVIKWLAWSAFVDVRILGILKETTQIG
jgi:HD superfamily phosphodiesterase